MARKTPSSSVYMILLFFIALSLPQLDAQFQFPRLPSAPRLLFGGFRPLFPSTRARRPPRRPPPIVIQRPRGATILRAPIPFTRPQQNRLRRPTRPFRTSAFPTTRAVNFNNVRRPTPAFRPQQFQQQFHVHHQQQVQQQLQHQPQHHSTHQPQIHHSTHQPQPQPVHQTTHHHVQPQQQSQIEINGFGAPKPQSVIHTSELPHHPPQSSIIENQFVHQPVNFIPDNNIVGMIPPPETIHSGNTFTIPFPPSSGSHSTSSNSNNLFSSPGQVISKPSVHQTITNHISSPQPTIIHTPPPQQTLSQVHHVQPAFEQLEVGIHEDPNQFQFVPLGTLPRRPNQLQHTSISSGQNNIQNVEPPRHQPQQPQPIDVDFNSQFNSINSNAISELLINKVPAVNAGVLPLAHEKPSQLELFPPFTRRRG